jgi:hypothetical protein
MIRKLMDRLGAGAVAATGLTLLALALAGMAGLDQRLDAAARPSAPAVFEDVEVDRRDCPHRDDAPSSAPTAAPATEL